MFAVVFPADFALVNVRLDRVFESLERETGSEIKLPPSNKNNSLHLQERLSLCPQNTNNRIARNADQGNGRNRPTECVCPFRIFVMSVVVRRLLVVDQTEDPQRLCARDSS